MSQKLLRCNLSAANVPFYTDQMGRSIILPQYDQNADRTVLSAADSDKDKGIPQVFYLHNALPTGTGFQSVGYDTPIAGLAGHVDFDQCITLRDSSENKVLLVPAQGGNYVWDATVGVWINPSAILPSVLPAHCLVTHAYVRGKTYVYYEKYGCFEYNTTTKLMTPVVLTGLVADQIRGICSSSGYLIAIDINNVVYWSSTTTETDFVPSLVTGAGSLGITDIRGPVVGILPITAGFLVYTTNNVVSATFSNNVRFPFIFREVESSCGIQSIEAVTYESNNTEHFAWTAAGVQKINKSSATFVYPELSQFIASKMFEDFDESTLLFTTTYATSPLQVKLTVIGKYLLFSYGLSSLTHVLVFDIALKRWGKLKIDHTDCFEYTYPNFYGLCTYASLHPNTYASLAGTAYSELSSRQNTGQVPLHTVGFLQADGTIKLLNMDIPLSATGVFLIGKYQFTRSNLFTLQGFDVENIGANQNFNSYVMVSYDGKTLQPAVAPYLAITTPTMKTYLCKLTGINASLLFVGAFNLTSIQITFTKHGDR